MNDITPRKIKTGSDPRTLPDYAAVRAELGKLKHPARPDVNWHYVEKCCLSLFEQNGVELQTAAWYTLARMQLAGIFGLNEGLAIMEALISHQWETLWPQPVHARMEILSSLGQRLQQRMRTLPLTYSDLSQLYRAEQLLTSLGAVLENQELKHQGQLDTLRTLMHNSAVRLEKSDGTSGSGEVIKPDIVQPAGVMNGPGASVDMLSGSSAAEKNEPHSTVKWMYVPQQEPQPNVEVLAAMPAPVKKWKPFAAGMLTMLVISAVGIWCWHKINPLPAIPLPVAANEATLKALEQLPPQWRQDYGFQLAGRAEPAEADKLKAQWQRYIVGNALPPETLSGWHQGMEGLNEMTRRLNALDERKGKYLTGSELKSMVFTITQNFERARPVEELLYQMSQANADTRLSAGQLAQINMQLNQLLNSYALLRQSGSSVLHDDSKPSGE